MRRAKSYHRIAAPLMATVAFVAVAPSPSTAAPEAQGYPVGYRTRSVDPRVDPWIAVTEAMVRPLLTRTQRRTRHAHRLVVDYDADGVPDVAVMVRNRSQIAVLVTLGRDGRTFPAYRADGRWSDQSLRRIGGRTVGIVFPESSLVVLSMESGRPMVYYPQLDEP